MAFKCSLVYLVALFCCIAAQGKSTDELIDEVYGKGSDDNTETTGQKPSTDSENPKLTLQPNTNVGNRDEGGSGGIPGTGSCTCIPYYLCNNGSINTNGEGIIDIRHVFF